MGLDMQASEHACGLGKQGLACVTCENIHGRDELCRRTTNIHRYWHKEHIKNVHMCMLRKSRYEN